MAPLRLAASLCAALTLHVAPVEAQDDDPVRTRAVALKLAKFLEGRIVEQRGTVMRLNTVSVSEAPAASVRRYLFSAERDLLAGLEFNASRTEATLALGCGDERLGATPAEEILPADLTLFEKGGFVPLSALLGRSIPELAGRLPAAAPIALPAAERGKFEQCTKVLDLLAEEFPLVSFEAHSADGRRIQVRRNVRFRSELAFNPDEIVAPLRFVLAPRELPIELFSMQVKVGAEWVSLRRDGGRFTVGDAHQQALAAQREALERKRGSPGTVNASLGASIFSVEYRIRLRNRPIKLLAFRG